MFAWNLGIKTNSCWFTDYGYRMYIIIIWSLYNKAYILWKRIKLVTILDVLNSSYTPRYAKNYFYGICDYFVVFWIKYFMYLLQIFMNLQEANTFKRRNRSTE